MSAELFAIPFQCVVVSGLAVPGATLTFYTTGTTTKQPVYTTSALTTQQTNPVVANGAGNIPNTYLDTAITYRVVIKNKAGTVLNDTDPYIPGVTTLGITLTSASGQAVNSRGALAALSPVVNNQVAFLTEVGREGMFVFDTSNLSASVTADPQQGIYVGPASTSSGASGAWVRRFSGAVNATWFGAEGDDSTNNAVPLQKAYDWALANSHNLYIPGGIYRTSTTINWNVNNFRVFGDGWLKTIIKPTGSVPAVVISGNYGRVFGIGADGSIAGTYGFICKSFNSGVFEWCDARNFDNDGLLFDPTWGGGAAGNNNVAKVRSSSFNLNGRNGVRLIQHGDNNDIAFDNINCSSNAASGMVAKAQGGTVDSSSIFEGNGGYGIEIGEDTDTSYHTDWIIDRPWLESNALGGVRGSAFSSSNIVRLKNLGNPYSRNALASDSVEYDAGGLHRFGSNDGDNFLQASAAGGSAFFLASSVLGSNVNLILGGAGTGNVQTQAALVAGGSTAATAPGTGFVSTPSVTTTSSSTADGYVVTHAIDHGASGGQVYLQSVLAAATGFSAASIRTRNDDGMGERIFFDKNICRIPATAGYFVGADKVVGAQQAAIANATDAASAITQLNLLLAAARAHGLIAT